MRRLASEISEIGRGSGDVRVQLSMPTERDEQMLREVSPEDFADRNDYFFDTATNRVVRRSEKVFRDLVLESIHRDAQPGPEAWRVLAAISLPLGQKPRADEHSQGGQKVTAPSRSPKTSRLSGKRPIRRSIRRYSKHKWL